MQKSLVKSSGVIWKYTRNSKVIYSAVWQHGDQSSLHPFFGTSHVEYCSGSARKRPISPTQLLVPSSHSPGTRTPSKAIVFFWVLIEHRCDDALCFQGFAPCEQSPWACGLFCRIPKTGKRVLQTSRHQLAVFFWQSNTQMLIQVADPMPLSARTKLESGLVWLPTRSAPAWAQDILTLSGMCSKWLPHSNAHQLVREEMVLEVFDLICKISRKWSHAGHCRTTVIVWSLRLASTDPTPKRTAVTADHRCLSPMFPRTNAIDCLQQKLFALYIGGVPKTYIFCLGPINDDDMQSHLSQPPAGRKTQKHMQHLKAGSRPSPTQNTGIFLNVLNGINWKMATLATHRFWSMSSLHCHRSPRLKTAHGLGHWDSTAAFDS